MIITYRAQRGTYKPSILDDITCPVIDLVVHPVTSLKPEQRMYSLLCVTTGETSYTGWVLLFMLTEHGSYNVIHQVFDCSYSQHQEQGHQCCIPWQGTYLRNTLQKTNKIGSVQSSIKVKSNLIFHSDLSREKNNTKNFKWGCENEQNSVGRVWLLCYLGISFPLAIALAHTVWFMR